jgi:hypothetical protein
VHVRVEEVVPEDLREEYFDAVLGRARSSSSRLTTMPLMRSITMTLVRQ